MKAMAVNESNEIMALNGAMAQSLSEEREKKATQIMAARHGGRDGKAKISRSWRIEK